MNTTVSLTEQELAHVLVGLRMLQSSIESVGFDNVRDEFPQMDGLPFLGVGEIGELCERINCAEEPKVSVRVNGGCVVGVRSAIPVSVHILDEDSDFDSAEEFNQAKDEYESLPLGVY